MLEITEIQTTVTVPQLNLITQFKNNELQMLICSESLAVCMMKMHISHYIYTYFFYTHWPIYQFSTFTVAPHCWCPVRDRGSFVHAQFVLVVLKSFTSGQFLTTELVSNRLPGYFGGNSPLSTSGSVVS